MPDTIHTVLLIYGIGAAVVFIIFMIISITVIWEPDQWEEPEEWREWYYMMHEGGKSRLGEYILIGCALSLTMAAVWPVFPFAFLMAILEDRNR